MDLADFIPYYPSVDDTNFNKVIYSKKEFRDIKIPPDEKLIEGELLSHQKLLSRLLSSHTPYNGMLLFHEMGTGKSCTVVGVIKQILSEKNGIDSYIYVASNEGLLANFKGEIEKCSGDEKLSEKSEKYKRETMQTFIKRDKYPNNLDNFIIIIDEVHNIREGGSALYNPLHSILHKVKNCKIILLSGTPMMNEAYEIASIMNLLLPTNQQLDYKAFDATFFDKKQKLINDTVLRNAFKGRVSYLKAMSSGVTQKFMGKMTTEKGKFILDASTMKGLQLQGYKKILAVDRSRNDVAHGDLLAASDMVLPVIRYETASRTVSEIFKKIKEDDYESKLNALREYSCKYADSIKSILKAKADKKSVFVFNDSVAAERGGLQMFAIILNYFGFAEYKENPPILTTMKDRYILMTGEDSNHNKFVRDAFNQPHNLKGEYIRVVLASSAISEGYSFQNVQVVDIHSPWYNFSKIAQAIARGIRAGSHQLIMEKLGVSFLDVEIHLRVSISDEAGVKSIDLDTYNVAETKDLMMKQIEHVIKEESIDARFNFERNTRDVKLNSSRDCDYKLCLYKPFPSEPTDTSLQLDCSTFLTYYNEDYSSCQKQIIDWFRKKSSITLSEMIKGQYKDKMSILLWTLNRIINTNTVIHKKYTKIPCYLREQSNNYFLVYDFAVNKSKEIDSYYVTNTHFVPASIKNVLPSTKKLCETIDSVCAAKTIKSLNFQMRTLTIEEKEEVLECNILEQRSETINEKFEGQYGKIKGVMYSWYLLEEQKRARKLIGESWENCTDNDINIIKRELQNRRDTAIANAIRIFGASDVYYGTFEITDEWLDLDDKTKSYIFRLVRYTADISTDKRTNYRGRTCTTFTNLKSIYYSLGLPQVGDNVMTFCNGIENKLIAENAMIRHTNILSTSPEEDVD